MQAFLADFSALAYFTTFLVVVAGVVAWRRIYSRAVSDVQDRVIIAQKSAIEALSEQVTSLTRQVAKLQSTLATVRYALKQQGIEIVLEDEYVVLKRTHLPAVTTIRLRRDAVQRDVERADIETSEEPSNGDATSSDSNT